MTGYELDEQLVMAAVYLVYDEQHYYETVEPLVLNFNLFVNCEILFKQVLQQMVMMLNTTFDETSLMDLSIHAEATVLNIFVLVSILYQQVLRDLICMKNSVEADVVHTFVEVGNSLEVVVTSLVYVDFLKVNYVD